MRPAIFSIGHSNHSIEKLLSLLKQHGITAVVDVRSQPHSRMHPQFNRQALRDTLQATGIAYVFLGRELGARTDDRSCFVNGRVNYDLLAQTALFRRGLERVRDGSGQYRIAMMCAEKDPLHCHRTILIARHLITEGMEVCHILADGSLESHVACIDRLIKQLRLPAYDLFRTKEATVADAYRIQGEAIAYDEESTRSMDGK